VPISSVTLAVRCTHLMLRQELVVGGQVEAALIAAETPSSDDASPRVSVPATSTAETTFLPSLSETKSTAARPPCPSNTP